MRSEERRVGNVSGVQTCALPIWRPSSRIERQLVQSRYWGTERLGPRALVDLSRRGISPRSPVRPIPILAARLSESFDIPEHRVLKAFLSILDARGAACARAAVEHIRAIEADRPWRDIAMAESPSLYESVDLPRIGRLTEALQRVEQLRVAIQAMDKLPLLKHVTPRLDELGRGAFQRSPEYQE